MTGAPGYKRQAMTHQLLASIAGLWALTALSCRETAGPDNVCEGVTLGGGSTVAAFGSLTFGPCPADLSGGEVTVVFTFSAGERQPGISRVLVSGTTPTGIRPECSVASPAGGNSADGIWRCSWVLNRYAEPGVWVVRANVWDSAGNQDIAVTSLPVVSALPDTVPPVLTGIAYPEEQRILGGDEARELIISGSDAESGMWRVEVHGLQERPGYDWSCAATVGVWPILPASPDVWRPQSDYSPGCPMTLQESSNPVLWTIREVRLIDLWQNQRVYGEAELLQAGFITQIDVSK
jgi:hypothetical protein